jgi:predicted nucleic acid-binding protein
MNDLKGIKVFADNCILSASDTMQGVKKRQKINWGGSVETVDILGYERKPLPDKSQAWKKEQIECLPTVGRIARQQLISLYTYVETRYEGWKRPGSFPSIGFGNVFEGVSLTHVEAAVERSYFFSMGLGEYIQKRSVVEFCEWLLSIDPDIFIEKVARLYELPVFLLKNLRNISRYRELCEGLSTKQYPDAFHLWTAEVNGAEYFLTIDGKFIRAMTVTKKLKLPCRPLSPAQLLDEMSILVRDPFKYAEGKFYNLLGIPS